MVPAYAPHFFLFERTRCYKHPDQELFIAIVVGLRQVLNFV